MEKKMRMELRHAGTALLVTVALGAQAMEDESIYSYALVEAGAAKVRGAAGSVQSLAVDGWIGGDFNRLWYSLDAEQRSGRTEAAELQVLYGRYIRPFWDAQIGLRRDERPQQRDYLALGVRGLAPYAFDVDLKLFIRDDGKVFARTRFENSFLITNRFIISPSVDLEWSASDIDTTVRRGAYQVDVGVQARYEFNRRVAPYLGLKRTFYPRSQSGGETAATQWQAGLRLLF